VSVFKPEAHAKSPLSRARSSLCALLLLFASAESRGAAQDAAANEIVWKANFLAKSAAYIEWPVESPLHMQTHFGGASTEHFLSGRRCGTDARPHFRRQAL